MKVFIPAVKKAVKLINELAGKNEASADSFRNAIYTAIDVVRNRKIYEEISKDPLNTERNHNGGRNDTSQDNR